MTVLNFLSIVNDNAGIIGLGLTLFVLPYLKKLASTYKDNKAAANILGALTRGAELGAEALMTNRLPSKAEAVQMAIDYARRSYPDAFARMAPAASQLQDMAQAQLEPVLRAAIASEAAKVALDRAGAALGLPSVSGEGVG